jgi:tRNA nucleotidyltransferase (CCA-adding enzyme)
MEIIVTHDVSDFDALSSAVAAQKLHPEAVITLGRRLSRGVRDFLALHKDRFRYKRVTEIDQSEVEHLIVVDVRRKSRLSGFETLLSRIEEGDETLRITVWDHHGASADDLPADEAVVEPVGSATTLLIEEMRARGIDVEPVEATLFALGIHTDTGSLVHGTSTARDAKALSWLMDRGASLSVVNRYLSEPFSRAQRDVLSAVLSVVETEELAGLTVGFAILHTEKVVEGVDVVTSEALSLLGYHALFGLFVARKKVQVVGRARSEWIDVGAVLRTVGGGGHAPAAAAYVKGMSAEDVRSAIETALRENPPRPRRVGDVMSTPVTTVAPDLPLSELAESLRTWRHTGVPVLRDGSLAGVVSRRDVEKAARGDRLHLPVSSCMSSQVETTTPDVLLEDALEVMVKHDIGRLPVLRDDHVVGIVTRSDILRFLYDRDESAVAGG